MSLIRPIFAAVGAAGVAACSVVGDRSGYEETPYEVIDRVGDAAEVRRYRPRLAAEVAVPSEGDRDGGSRAFRLLFDYISGMNAPEAKIAMTTPVEVKSGGREIAMTTPVGVETAPDGVMRMRFFLPAALTFETAPRPLDPRVRLVEVPGETYAVRRFAGWGGKDAVRTEEAGLRQALERAPWTPTGTAFAFFYDPPWTLPFWRRNEVAVPVEPATP